MPPPTYESLVDFLDTIGHSEMHCIGRNERFAQGFIALRWYVRDRIASLDRPPMASDASLTRICFLQVLEMLDMLLDDRSIVDEEEDTIYRLLEVVLRFATHSTMHDKDTRDLTDGVRSVLSLISNATDPKTIRRQNRLRARIRKLTDR